MAQTKHYARDLRIGMEVRFLSPLIGYAGTVAALGDEVLCYRTGVNGVPAVYARTITLSNVEGRPSTSTLSTSVKDGQFLILGA